MSGDTEVFTSTPYFMVHVMDGTEDVVTPGDATCALGGSSYPMAVSVAHVPFADLTVTLSTYVLDAAVEDDVDLSEGLTLADDMSTVSFSTTSDLGYLGFTCATTIADSAKLYYTLSGTDMDAYSLTNADVDVTGTELAEELEDPGLTLTVNADSTASMTTLEALCPDTGAAVIWLAPTGTTAPANDEDTLMDSVDEYEAE